ncbi:MAG: hypothetical protein R3D29_15680 [Nitratireductor sp.]
MTGQPDLTLTSGKNGTSIALTGAWTASHATRLEELADSIAAKAATAKSVTFELSGIDELDTYGAWSSSGPDANSRNPARRRACMG